tara:strand:+ start:2340 stop:2711 length:372 start_codon:yes stop_codon:yes gene_type:complete
MIGFFLSLLLVAAIGGDSSNQTQLTKQEAISILVITGWPEAVRSEALNVMECESSLITDRVGDGGNSIGLFQIQWAPDTWKGWKYADGMQHLKHKKISDPIINAQVALIIYREYGWTPWVCRP